MAEEAAFDDGAAPIGPHGDAPEGPYGDAPRPGERGFLPATPPRARAESVVVRLIATAGVIGIGTAIGAIMGAYDVAGWIVGLVASAVTVVLAAILWRSRRL